MRQPAKCEIRSPTRAAWTSRARRQHSHDGAERPDFVIDEDRHLVASANRIESKRRSCKDDISWREIGGRVLKLPPKPLERGPGAAGHWPQFARCDETVIDADRQRACSVYVRPSTRANRRAAARILH